MRFRKKGGQKERAALRDQCTVDVVVNNQKIEILELNYRLKGLEKNQILTKAQKRCNPVSTYESMGG